MKIHPLIESLFLEWRFRVHNGTPDPKDAGHISILREICLERGISPQAINNAMLVLEKDGGLDDKEKEKAKKKGLVSKGYGNWGPEGGDTTHKTQDGKLVPIGGEDGEEEEQTKQMKIDANPFDTEDGEGGDDSDNENQSQKGKLAIDQLDIPLKDSDKNKLLGHQKTTTDWLRSSGEDKAIKTGAQPTPEAMEAHNRSADLLEKLWGGTPLEEEEKLFLSKWVRVVEPTENAPNRFRIYVAREEGNFSRGKGLYAERMGKKAGFGDALAGAKLQKWMQDNGVATQRTSTYGGKLSTPNQTFADKDGKTKLLEPKLNKESVVRDGEGKTESVKISDKLTLTRIKKNANETPEQRKLRQQNNNSLDEYARLIENGDLDFIDMDEGVMPDSPENRVIVIQQSLGRIADRLGELGNRPIAGVPKQKGVNPPPVDDEAKAIIQKIKEFSKRNPNEDPEQWFDDLQDVMIEMAGHETLEQGWANYAEIYDAIREMHDDGKGTENGRCALLPESTTLETVDILTITEVGKGTNKIVTIDGRSVKKGAGGPSQLTAKVRKSGMKPTKARTIQTKDGEKQYPALDAKECRDKCIALSEKHDKIYTYPIPATNEPDNEDIRKEEEHQNRVESEIIEMARELGVSEDYIKYIKKKMNEGKTTKAGKTTPSPVESATRKIMQDRAKSTDRAGNPLSSSKPIEDMMERRMQNYYLYQALSHRAYNQNLDYQNFANDSINIKKGKIEVSSSNGVSRIAWPKFEFNIGFSVEGRSTNPGGGRFHNKQERPLFGGPE